MSDFENPSSAGQYIPKFAAEQQAKARTGVLGASIGGPVTDAPREMTLADRILNLEQRLKGLEQHLQANIEQIGGAFAELNNQIQQLNRFVGK